MKILYAIASFQELTGAEMYVYELAREMSLRGHDIIIASPRIGGEISERAKKAGIEVSPLMTSLLSGIFDIVHTQEPRPTAFVLKNVKAERFVCTVHSQWPCENVVNDSRISHYICIRSDIQKKIIVQDRIPSEKTSVIHNGIDFSRFRIDLNKSVDPVHRKRVLFAGTIDDLRKDTIRHLLRRSQEEKFDLWISGKFHLREQDRFSFYVDLQRNLVKYFLPIWNIETLIQEADETAGIMLGRSTIEGWACGKRGWIYDVALDGTIKSYALHDVPEDMSVYDIKTVADKVLSVYTGERKEA